MRRVVGLGAGGHAKVVIEILRQMGDYELVGLVDKDRGLWGEDLLGVPIIGDDSLLPGLYAQGVCCSFIGLGTVGDVRPRRRLYEAAHRMGFDVVSAIHPQSIIAPSAKLGLGSTIMAGAIINSASRLGDDVIVNTGAIVDHDCLIEDHVHIATGARLAGAVHVGEGSHIGVGSSICQCIDIGKNSIVGAGAVVVDDVPDNAVVVGVPAGIIRMCDS